MPVNNNSSRENLLSEELRRVMRHWTTGVAVVSSFHQGTAHGMTVNSFTSVSLDPPLVSITLANHTRTLKMVLESGFFGVSILGAAQAEIADRFAGKIKENADRFAGVQTFILEYDIPLISDSLAYLNCKVYLTHPLPNSTLILGEVIAASETNDIQPLVYQNREYHLLPRSG